jgi:hypothetical protein
VGVGEQIRCACSRLNDPWRRYCGGCGTALGTGCLCGFPNGDTDRFCGGCGVTTVHGRASSADLRITTMALRAAGIDDGPTEVEPEPPERRSIDEMTILRRPAPKTEENEPALQFHDDTSTQRIEMLLDAVATDPNT